jgi:hypothetical protein
MHAEISAFGSVLYFRIVIAAAMRGATKPLDRSDQFFHMADVVTAPIESGASR